MVSVAGRRKAEAIGHDHVFASEREGIALSRSQRHRLLLCYSWQGFHLLVVLAQTIRLDVCYQHVGIVAIGGIASRLQTVCPSAIVILRTPATRCITVAHQELRVMVDTLLDGSIVAELLIWLIIVMQTVRLALGEPLLAALDAEVVVA